MIEIVSVNLENEMDLILAHRRSLKLAELCGISLILQTAFATAVSEISRCVINTNGETSLLQLGLTNEKGARKELVARITSHVDFKKSHADALKYATRLIDKLSANKTKDGNNEVVIIQKINFAGLINDVRVQAFISYFKKEPPISPYDEIRKKNIQLLEMSEKLKESEGQYRILSETLPLMVFTTNATGHLTYANKWFKDYFKLLDIQSGKLSWLSFLHTNKNIAADWDKSQVAQSNFSAQAQLRSVMSEAPLWHLISLIPAKNEQGQVESFTGFFVDIHAQKLVEETLKNNEELVSAQKQLINSQAKLETNLKELNKSNHDLEQFAYIASHDLQEPLRKIQNFTELLGKNITDEEKATKYLGKIDASSHRMSRLIKDVLNYSRLSKAGAQFETTDLQKIFNDVKNDLELKIEEKNASVSTTGLPVITGIHQQLHQLFYNLINNSLKFTYEKPVISVTARPLNQEEVKKIPELHSSINYTELIFKDNGIGFDQSYATQIFVIFKRLNSKETFEGTGIGLALCKKIVDNHHGIIEAFSEPGKGTEFKVILPVH